MVPDAAWRFAGSYKSDPSSLIRRSLIASQLLFVYVGLLALPPRVVGQIAPFELTQTINRSTANGKPRASLGLQLLNKSPKPIVGIVVRVWFGSSGGGRIVVGSLITSGKLVDGKVGRNLDSGSAVRFKPIDMVLDASGREYQTHPEIDLIIYADGTTWGLGTSSAAVKLRDEIEALGLVGKSATPGPGMNQ